MNSPTYYKSKARTLFSRALALFALAAAVLVWSVVAIAFYHAPGWTVPAAPIGLLAVIFGSIDMDYALRYKRLARRYDLNPLHGSLFEAEH